MHLIRQVCVVALSVSWPDSSSYLSLLSPSAGEAMYMVVRKTRSLVVILLCRTSGTRIYRGRDLILDQKLKDQVDTEVGRSKFISFCKSSSLLGVGMINCSHRNAHRVI
jgi:hypothetical protein